MGTGVVAGTDEIPGLAPGAIKMSPLRGSGVLLPQINQNVTPSGLPPTICLLAKMIHRIISLRSLPLRGSGVFLPQIYQNVTPSGLPPMICLLAKMIHRIISLRSLPLRGYGVFLPQIYQNVTPSGLCGIAPSNLSKCYPLRSCLPLSVCSLK